MFQKLVDLLNEEKKKKGKNSEKINKFLDGKNFILFFTKDNNVFGAPEDSRIVFSKMKSDDPDWADEGQFTALNLAKALAGNSEEDMFSQADIPHIQVIDRDDVANHLPDEEPTCGKKFIIRTQNV